MTLFLFVVSLLGIIAIGTPIAFALLLTGVVLMYHLDFFDAQLVSQNMINGADNFPLMAVPFFMLAGELMNAGGISRRIVNLAVTLVGHIKGGLGYVAIGAAVLLASISGSAIADTAALASLLVPMMRDNGYRDDRAVGLIASGGIIAPIIPPSIAFIIFGVTTNISITKLFFAGIAPGVMMGLALIVTWALVVRSETVTTAPKQPLKVRLKALLEAFWALLLPVIIVGGLRSGIFTPTEAAVVAAVYALLVSLFVYRELRLSQLLHVLVNAAKTTSVVMFLVAAALVASYMITLADLPRQVVTLLGPVIDNPTLLMAAIVVLLLIIGMAMDLTPTILILAPVLLPLVQKAGLDPVYFGVMFVLVGSVGLITPPVGTVLSVVSGVGKVPMERAVKGSLPFLLAYMVLLTLFVLFPEMITVPARWFQ